MTVNPNGYDKLAAIVRTTCVYVSIHSIFFVPASAKHNSPVDCEMANEFGNLTAGSASKISRSVPSKLDHSIFGPSRFQSDQYNLLLRMVYFVDHFGRYIASIECKSLTFDEDLWPSLSGLLNVCAQQPFVASDHLNLLLQLCLYWSQSNIFDEISNQRQFPPAR